MLKTSMDKQIMRGAIAKYTEALEESTKRGVKTEVIDKDFPHARQL